MARGKKLDGCLKTVIEKNFKGNTHVDLRKLKKTLLVLEKKLKPHLKSLKKIVKNSYSLWKKYLKIHINSEKIHCFSQKKNHKNPLLLFYWCLKKSTIETFMSLGKRSSKCRRLVDLSKNQKKMHFTSLKIKLTPN